MSTVLLKKGNCKTVTLICPPATGFSGERQIAAYIAHSAVSTAEFTSEQAQNTTIMGYMSSPKVDRMSSGHKGSHRPKG